MHARSRIQFRHWFRLSTCSYLLSKIKSNRRNGGYYRKDENQLKLQTYLAAPFSVVLSSSHYHNVLASNSKEISQTL